MLRTRMTAPVSIAAGTAQGRTRTFVARVVVLAATLTTLAAAQIPSGAKADPVYQTMNAAGGIYWRSSPDWNTPVAEAGNGVYNGTTISVHCYQLGTTVPGSADTMWEQATVLAGPGHGSGWVNEHFINDGSAINQPSPGVGPCHAPPPPAPTPNPGGLVFTVFNAEGGIYYRNSPHWSDTSQTVGVGVFNGDTVELICGAFGDPVGPYGDTAWSYVRNLTRPGIGDGWVNEHFIDDGAGSNQFVAGEPGCDSGVTGMPGSAPASAPAPGGGCAPYMVIDSRGSGEPYPTFSPPGKAFVNELRNRHRSARVSLLANPYPAVGLWGSVGQVLNLIGAGLGIGPLGAYHGSIVDGERWLSATIPSESSVCPSTKLLLTGYSQGAQAALEASATNDAAQFIPVGESRLAYTSSRTGADAVVLVDDNFKPIATLPATDLSDVSADGRYLLVARAPEPENGELQQETCVVSTLQCRPAPSSAGEFFPNDELLLSTGTDAPPSPLRGAFYNPATGATTQAPVAWSQFRSFDGVIPTALLSSVVKLIEAS